MGKKIVTAIALSTVGVVGAVVAKKIISKNKVDDTDIVCEKCSATKMCEDCLESLECFATDFEECSNDETCLHCKKEGKKSQESIWDAENNLH